MADTEDTEPDAHAVLSKNIDEFVWATLPQKILQKFCRQLELATDLDKRGLCQQLATYEFCSEVALELINFGATEIAQEDGWTEKRYNALLKNLGYMNSTESVRIALLYNNQKLQLAKEVLEYNEEVLSK